MNASLGNFEDAVHDLNIAKKLELSFSGQRQIESELRIITDMFERTESSLVQHKENELDLLGRMVLDIHIWYFLIFFFNFYGENCATMF